MRCKADNFHISQYTYWLKDKVVWCFIPDIDQSKSSLYVYLHRKYREFGIKMLVVEGVCEGMEEKIDYYDCNGAVLLSKEAKRDADIFIAECTDVAGVSGCKGRPAHKYYIIVDEKGIVIDTNTPQFYMYRNGK